jgi:AcrR family transcriptional regulator
MSSSVAERVQRSSPRAVAKFEARRAQLAGSAILTLAESGYANTSLRDIAQNSDFSHGVLHYYFEDKLDLISYCVRQYKTECVKRYDDVVANSRTPEQLKRGFLKLLCLTLVDDAPMHRLWYDLRAQSLFEQGLRADAIAIDQALERMVWNVVARYCDLSGRQPGITPELAYGLMDGVFQRCLLAHVAGDERAVSALRRQAGMAIDGTLGTPL